jgi:hypothetical protein
MTYLAEANIIDDARPFFTLSDTLQSQIDLINDIVANVESDLDLELSRHVVEG